MPEPIDVDVCLVGAGYSGLAAARELARHGRTVAVLEARDRIGGRIWTEPTPSGVPVDRGGAWLGPQHDVMFRLAYETGVSTYKTYVRGKHLLVDGDRIRRYTGLIPKISPLAVASIAANQLRIDRMARHVPVDAPWSAPRAAEWDAMSLAQWLQQHNVRPGIGRELFEMAVRGLFTGDLDDVSFLHFLWLAHAHGSINTLFSIENGAQENLVDGGAGEIARRMAVELGDAVHLETPVSEIAQPDDHVVVTSDRVTVAACHCVVTVPPALALEIAFDPPLPDDRLTLYKNAIAGPESKTLLVYETPFWRDAGFSGQTSEPGSASEVTIDASPMAGTPGVLASFTFGPVAAHVDTLDPADRRRAVLDALTKRLGPRAASPVEYVETAWFNEVWTRGCSMAHLRPGILHRYGPLLREPFGRIHWAGTETSTVSHGAMEGAVRSGERAATEILDRT